MLTKLCNWQHSARWRLLSRRKPARSFHHSSGVHGNSHKHLRLLEEIYVLSEPEFWLKLLLNKCSTYCLQSNHYCNYYCLQCNYYDYYVSCYKLWVVDLLVFAFHLSYMWLSSLTNNLTLFRVGDLHYRIWSIILRNRLQVSPLLSVSETQKHGGGFLGS